MRFCHFLSAIAQKKVRIQFTFTYLYCFVCPEVYMRARYIITRRYFLQRPAALIKKFKKWNNLINKFHEVYVENFFQEFVQILYGKTTILKTQCPKAKYNLKLKSDKKKLQILIFFKSSLILFYEIINFM